MADVKISQLPVATTPVAGTEVLPIVQSGITAKVSINDATGITRPFTAKGVMYASSATALATGNTLEFDGTNFGVGTAGNTMNQKSVLYMPGAVAGYFQISNGGLGLAATNGLRLGVTAAGLGELYAPTSLAYYINNTERARIDSSGKVGINVVPAAGTDAKLQLTGLTTNATTLATAYSAASLVVVPKSTSGFSLAIASGTGDAPQLQVSANGAAAGDLLIQPYGGSVGIGTSSPSASTILDAQSTTKGVRMPNMTTTQKNAIASPAAGLMVFDTTLSKLAVYSGTAWQTITSV